MKKLVRALVAVGVIGLAAHGASAEVTGLTAKLAGGCQATNTGTCTIRVSASGTDLASDSVVLENAETAKGPFRYVSKTTRTLSESGSATMKFRNKSGCYKVVTAPNGDDAADVRSRIVCEK